MPRPHQAANLLTANRLRSGSGSKQVIISPDKAAPDLDIQELPLDDVLVLRVKAQ